MASAHRAESDAGRSRRAGVRVLLTPIDTHLHLQLTLHILRTLVDAGWSSQVARRAHNPKVVGSNPAPATTTRWLARSR